MTQFKNQKFKMKTKAQKNLIISKWTSILNK